MLNGGDGDAATNKWAADASRYCWHLNSKVILVLPLLLLKLLKAEQMFVSQLSAANQRKLRSRMMSKQQVDLR